MSGGSVESLDLWTSGCVARARTCGHGVRLIEIVVPSAVAARPGDWAWFALPGGLLRRFRLTMAGGGAYAVEVRWADNDPACRVLWALVEGALVSFRIETSRDVGRHVVVAGNRENPCRPRASRQVCSEI